MAIIERVPANEAAAERCPDCGSNDVVRGERTTTQATGIAVIAMRCRDCGNRPTRIMSWSTTRTARLLFEALDGWYPDPSANRRGK
jgi:hypothetical protein